MPAVFEQIAILEADYLIMRQVSRNYSRVPTDVCSFRNEARLLDAGAKRRAGRQVETRTVADDTLAAIGSVVAVICASEAERSSDFQQAVRRTQTGRLIWIRCQAPWTISGKRVDCRQRRVSVACSQSPQVAGRIPPYCRGCRAQAQASAQGTPCWLCCRVASRCEPQDLRRERSARSHAVEPSQGRSHS